MEIVETPFFTTQITRNMSDDEYLEICCALVTNPALGTVIRHSGGLRKLRWGYGGRGKRGGCRIIYYWYVEENELLMLLFYAKNEVDDLTKDQLVRLQSIVERELK